MRLPQTYFCIKFENADNVKWFKAKKNRNKENLIKYFRSLPSFKWGKVYDAKSNQQLFWFNTMTDGYTDARTSDKKTYV